MIPTLLLGVAMAAHLEVYARGLDDAGALLALDDGTVLVSRPALNDVLSLRDVDGDGRVDAMRTALSFIDHAHGLAIHDDTLYVAGVKELVSAQRQPDGSFAETRVLVEDLPDGGPHPERALAIGPDDKLYVAIAGTCASCTESNPEHGTLLQFDRDGANRRIFARGLRDRTAFAWHPKTHELWGAERAKLLRIGEGFDDRAGSATAALSLPRRLVPSAFAFEKNGDAFAAIGARVVRIHFAEGKPASIEDYATIEGRIGGLALARDGALLVSDAEHGIVYRVTRNHPPMTSSASEINAQPILAKAFAVRGLRHPQSVIHDEVQDVYFVSTGSGVIARVTPDGRIESPKFIRGLDAPRGMTIVRDVLWVADRDAVRSFDRFTGAPLQTIALAKSGATSLTSIAAGGDELLYVADAGGRIFRIHDDGVAEIVARGEELRSPNALAWDGTRFLIAPALGREVLAWTPGAVPKAVLRGPGAFDGIVVLPTGTVIVSSEHDEALHVSQGNVLRPLFRRAPAPAGIGFDRKRNRLLIPSAEGNWLEAWTLPPLANDDAAVASTSRERALSAEGFRGTSSTTR